MTRYLEHSRLLVDPALEDDASGTVELDFEKLLSQQRGGCDASVMSKPQSLTLLEDCSGLPAVGSVGIVVLLKVASSELCRLLRNPGVGLRRFDEQVPMRPAAVHASGDEWNHVRNESLRRGVVSVIDRTCVPTVGGRPTEVGAFGVSKKGSPAKWVLRLVRNAIPSSTTNHHES